jgi:hypothetical protein
LAGFTGPSALARAAAAAANTFFSSFLIGAMLLQHYVTVLIKV